MQARVEKLADFLKLVFNDGEIKEEHILVSESLLKDKNIFFTLRDGTKMSVSFKERNSTIELIFERYKLKRIGPI